MNRHKIRQFISRSGNFLMKPLRWLRRINFKKIMGWILVLKTFNIIWLILMVVLFVALTVNDVNTTFRQTDDILKENYATFKEVSVWKKEKWAAGLEILKTPINYISDIITLFTGLLKRALWFLAFIALWQLLTMIASAYSQWLLGPAGGLARSGALQTPAPISPGFQTHRLATPPVNQLETPPLLIIDRVRVLLPVLLQEEIETGDTRMMRLFGFGERYLQFAHAVWPDRYQPLFHHQLSEKDDAAGWAIFWQKLIDRGLQSTSVETIVSPDCGEIESSFRHYLPNAKLVQSVETIVYSSNSD